MKNLDSLLLQCVKLLEIEKEIVHEVAINKHYLKQSADHKAQISAVNVRLTPY